MDLKTFKDKLLEDPEFKREYEKKDLAFEIGQIIAEARIVKGITQSKLAEMIGTKQSSIARAESGVSLPSLSFLKKIADAIKAQIILKLEFSENKILAINYDSLKGPKEKTSEIYINDLENNQIDPMLYSQNTESALIFYQHQ